MIAHGVSMVIDLIAMKSTAVVQHGSEMEIVGKIIVWSTLINHEEPAHNHPVLDYQCRSNITLYSFGVTALLW